MGKSRRESILFLLSHLMSPYPSADPVKAGVTIKPSSHRRNPRAATYSQGSDSNGLSSISLLSIKRS